jgi:hypothetical protein
MWARAFVGWLMLLMLAIANGAVREAVLTPNLGPAAAHVVSTLSLSLLIVCLAWLLMPFVEWQTGRDAALIGMFWTCLVLAFEFLAGHFLFGRSWAYLLADYNVLQGRIWLLVPLVTLFAPVWAWRVGRLRV